MHQARWAGLVSWETRSPSCACSLAKTAVRVNTTWTPPASLGESFLYLSSIKILAKDWCDHPFFLHGVPTTHFLLLFYLVD